MYRWNGRIAAIVGGSLEGRWSLRRRNVVGVPAHFHHAGENRAAGGDSTDSSTAWWCGDESGEAEHFWRVLCTAVAAAAP